MSCDVRLCLALSAPHAPAWQDWGSCCLLLLSSETQSVSQSGALTPLKCEPSKLGIHSLDLSASASEAMAPQSSINKAINSVLYYRRVRYSSIRHFYSNSPDAFLLQLNAQNSVSTDTEIIKCSVPNYAKRLTQTIHSCTTLAVTIPGR